MSNTFVTGDGGHLSYQIVGEGDPICFVHGFTLDKSMWERQVDFFSQKYQVITYDLRGFGHSSIPTQRYSHHQDLADLLNYLQIKETYVVGLSLGGEIAIDFALEYPEKVKKLILADSSLSGYKSTVDWNVHIENGGLEMAKKRWLEHRVFAYSQSNEEVKQKLSLIVNNYSGWHWLNKDLRSKAQPLALSRLGGINVPTLILVGEYDLSYFHDISNVLLKGVKGSKRVLIPSAGHMVNMDNFEYFNTEVEKFLKVLT